MKKILQLATLAIASVVILNGCRKDDFDEVTGKCPVVESTSPARGETNVPLVKIITATFNEKMDPASITSVSFSMKDTANLPGTVSYQGLTASFTPSVALRPNTTYEGKVTTIAKDLFGNHLQVNYVWTFSTDTAAMAPTIVSTVPANLAANVPLAQVVTANFSEAMDPATITAAGTFTVKQGATNVPGVVTYNGTTASFSPSANFASGVTYTAQVTTFAKNPDGVAMAGNYVWTFSTGAVVAPAVITTDPVDFANNVALNKTATARFSMPMDASTMVAANFTLRNGAIPVAGAVSFHAGSRTISFNPSVDLNPGATYTATITTGAKSSSGTPMASNHVWTFSTGAVVTPTVITTDPVDLASNVALNKTATATFSMPMDPSTMVAANFTLQNGANSVAGAVSYNSGTQTISFNPSLDLNPGTTYTATITTGAESSVGSPMASNYVWTFSTPSAVVPMVMVTDPANLASNVALNKTATATFSMPMDPSTMVAANFTLRNGASPVAGTVSYNSGSNTISFNPTADLNLGTTYTATITTGAESSSGTPMASNHVWTFSTLSPVPPTVIATDPVNLASNVAINKTATATFSMPMDPATMVAANFTLRNGAVSVAGAVTYNSGANTISFNPTVDLDLGTTYTATITTGAESGAGTPMASNHVWTFSTPAPVPPTVIATDPFDLATSVLINKTVTATFSIAMDPSTMVAANFTLQDGASPVAGTVSYNSGSQTISFNPTLDLDQGTLYTATITTGAESSVGTPMASNFVWTFTTAFPPPTVVSTDPFDLETNVVLNKVLSVSFSENMNPATLTNQTFTLMVGTTPVSGLVSTSGTTTTFTPSTYLLSDATYTATITTGAQSQATGLGLVSNHVWTFSTVPHLGPADVDLGTVERFGIISGVGVSNNAGFSEIHDMDVGIYPGVRSSIVGFPPAIVVNGAIYASDDISPPGVAAMLLQAKTDLTTAYLFAEGASTPAPQTVSGDQGGLTLAPGIYKSTSTLLIQSGDLTLDAQGDVNAVWIFQVASGFTTVGGAGGSVILSGGAQAKNVFWQTGSSAIIGDYTSFKGNILALTSITMNAYSTAEGRMLARNGSVTMTSTNIITRP